MLNGVICNLLECMYNPLLFLRKIDKDGYNIIFFHDYGYTLLPPYFNKGKEFAIMTECILYLVTRFVGIYM